MKALRSNELAAILNRDDFRSWWQNLISICDRLDHLRTRHEEMLSQIGLLEFKAESTQKIAIDELYRAGEWQDAAAMLVAQASEIENRSFEAVANFENQRILVGDLSSKIGAMEHRLLELQTEMQELKSVLPEKKIQEKSEDPEKTIKRREIELERLQKELLENQVLFERGSRRKDNLWEEVEQLWGRSLDLILKVSERRVKSKRIRQKAEALFKDAERYRIDVEALRKESEEVLQEKQDVEITLSEAKHSARNDFGCLIGEDFLYWPSRLNNKEVFCIPLRSQSSGYNIELIAKKIYLIERQKGVEFIQPLPQIEESEKDDDVRIDSFFSKTKKKSPKESA